MTTTTTVHDLPDDILKPIFLRLDSCASAVHAVSRFGSLHARRLAGHYHTVDPFFDTSPPVGGQPVFVPSPSMSTVVDPRRFALFRNPASATTRHQRLHADAARTRQAEEWSRRRMSSRTWSGTVCTVHDDEATPAAGLGATGGLSLCRCRRLRLRLLSMEVDR
ncbi:hypothetical protein HU200_013999 [Digitaria exilis]|uniref:F-box domain-containing protein n=1 Tax=Digitaria exilis TaxID=1010633 RepID=A0A835FCB6_9POAL|nr:hypothetical protein HU200_013999 [Digitaria exilis]